MSSVVVDSKAKPRHQPSGMSFAGNPEGNAALNMLSWATRLMKIAFFVSLVLFVFGTLLALADLFLQANITGIWQHMGITIGLFFFFSIFFAAKWAMAFAVLKTLNFVVESLQIGVYKK